MSPGREHHSHDAPAPASELRGRGRRLTRQRELIWKVFAAEPDGHLSAEDVTDRVRRELPGVNPSTVYRTLDLLVADGLLLRTDLGSDRAYYEPAREHAHHHLVCTGCGDVFHFHEQVLGRFRDRLEQASGYALGDDELTLFGTCPRCRSATS